jgi:hypothetical protein
LDDALLRLVLVGTTALPTFGLGFWAGARARDRRKAAISSAPVIPPHELTVELQRTAEEAGTASLAAPLVRGRTPNLGKIRALRPAAEHRGPYNEPAE